MAKFKKGGLFDGANSESEESKDIIFRNVNGNPHTPINAKTGAVLLGEQQQENSQKEQETTGIIGQIKDNLSRLNQTECLFEISEAEITNKYDEVMKVVQARLDTTNGIVKREGFGEIQVSARLKKAKAYLKTTAEKTAVLAVPIIIQKGIKIAEHLDHKGRAYPTYTFAGRITMGSKVGIVAVVVKKTTGNFYKVHRILAPDGNSFPIERTTD